MIAFVPRPPLRLLAAVAGVAVLAAWPSRPARVSVHGYVTGALEPLDRAALEHHLVVATEDGMIEVEYHGVLPDTIREGAEVLVRGEEVAPWLVDADELLGKCPSRHSPPVRYQ
jgi:cytochrome c-type biogenesis protein CcmE